ncbi:MAG TPA: hypothetical protein VFZ29_12310 [Solirubrobacterales bacterium]
MAVMARETWTDERLDDLNARVERGFDEVKGEIREVRGEVRELRTETNARFDSMQRTMIIGFVTMSASIIGGMIGALTLA